MQTDLGPFPSREGRTSPRLAGAVVLCLFFASPLAVLTSLAGLPFGLALLLSLAAAIGGAWWLAPRLPATLDEIFAGRKLWLLLWLLLGLLAAGRLAGVAQFMADDSQPWASALPFDDFYIGHSCLSAYYQAAEWSRDEGRENLYDPAPYQETSLGRFRLDEYLYPPPFLLLPRAGLLLSEDFLAWRAAWFVVEASVLLLAMLALAWWIGAGSIGGSREERSAPSGTSSTGPGSPDRPGPDRPNLDHSSPDRYQPLTGTLVALCAPLVWLGTPTALTLQIGNFQLVTFALPLLALVAFERGRRATGGALLAFAIASKLFPGLLALELLLRRRFREAAWTAGFGVAYALAALAVVGPNPFRAFIGFQMPRIASGEAFAWLGNEELAAVAAINDSLPGLVWKLRVLGLGVDPGWVSGAGWLYTLALVSLTWLAARRMATADRLGRAMVWLALLTLAGLRSPFEPDTYALFGSLWLLALWLPRRLGSSAERPVSAGEMALAAGAWLILATVVPFGGIALPAPAVRAGFTLLGQALTVALSLGAIFTTVGGRGRAPVAAESPPRPPVGTAWRDA